MPRWNVPVHIELSVFRGGAIVEAETAGEAETLVGDGEFDGLDWGDVEIDSVDVAGAAELCDE